MYTSPSLPPWLLPLSEVSVSDSSLSLPAKQSPCDSLLSCNVQQMLKIVVGAMVALMVMVVVVVVVAIFFRYVRDSASLVTSDLQVS